MLKCREYGVDLPDQAKFCMDCGAQLGMKEDVCHVSTEGLVGKVKDIIRDANVKRIVVKDEKEVSYSCRFLSLGEQPEQCSL